MSELRLRRANVRWLAGLAASLAIGVTMASAPTAFASAVAYWRLESHPAPTNLPLATSGGPGEGEIVVTAADLGAGAVHGENASEEVKIEDLLPEGVEATSVEAQSEPGAPGSTTRIIPSTGLRCPKLEHPTRLVACTYKQILPPYEQLEMWIRVKVTLEHAPAQTLENEVHAQGGGAKVASQSEPLKINGDPTEFGVERFELTPENEDGTIDSQAGAHPFQLTTTFDLNAGFSTHLAAGDDGGSAPVAPALERTLHVELPPGLVADASAAPKCAGVDFGAFDEKDVNSCPDDTAVGVAAVTFNDPITIGYTTFVVPVFNLAPAPGQPAQFGFSADHVPIVLNTSIRTGGNYGATITVAETSQAIQVLGSRVTIWGAPGDQIHEPARGWDCVGGGEFVEGIPGRSCPAIPASEPLPAFLTLPTSCGPLKAFVNGDAWNGAQIEGTEVGPGGAVSVGSTSSTELEGCAALQPLFKPTIEVETDQHSTSTPTGLSVAVNVPQEGTITASDAADPNVKADPDVRETTLTLPEELQTNAGAANGLTTCSAQTLGLKTGLGESTQLENQLDNEDFTSEPAACPQAAKIGTVEVETPLLSHKLEGAVYLADQDTNPFASPLVLYLIAEEEPNRINKEEPRVLVKLAGEVKINATTGQLVSTFKNTPQAPFEHLRLHLFDGPKASQATPARCGTYPVSVAFKTWASEASTSAKGGFEINSDCPPAGPLPFSPHFEAGSLNSQAGAFSPFTVTIKHPDGQQALESIDTELPPGLAALISEVTPCTEEQAENNACPAASVVGHTTSVSGLGEGPGKESPVTLGGQLYLTGQLKATSKHGAAPYGLLAVTKAEAGPFNLGLVKVLSTININETTAAATVKSEPIPKMLKGVPVQLKEINVTVERPEGKRFEFNPTNCEELKIKGALTGYEEGSVALDQSFFASNCASLPFAPKLTASVVGHGSKADGTEFKVTVESPGLGQANIHKVDLTIPTQLSSRLSTLQQACLESVFRVNPAACDEGSVIGEGIVYTPVFRAPLRGPAYLVAHGGAQFPDVEFVLQGEYGVKIVLDGKTDIKAGVTYSKFESAPDAPFTKFETILPAGPHSAFTPNVPEKEEFSLCKTSLSIPTEITGQNGAFISQDTNVAVTGCGGVKGVKTTKLTRAQQLAKALKACKKDKKKGKRVACERQARKKYGPIKKSAKKAGKKKR